MSYVVWAEAKECVSAFSGPVALL